MRAEAEARRGFRYMSTRIAAKGDPKLYKPTYYTCMESAHLRRGIQRRQRWGSPSQGEGLYTAYADAHGGKGLWRPGLVGNRVQCADTTWVASRGKRFSKPTRVSYENEGQDGFRKERKRKRRRKRDHERKGAERAWERSGRRESNRKSESVPLHRGSKVQNM